jgi:sugar phosphate permease
MILMPHGWRLVFQTLSLVGIVGASIAYVLIKDEDELAMKVAEVKAAASPSKTAVKARTEAPLSAVKTPDEYSLAETLLYNHEVQLIFASAMFAYFALCMLTDWFSLYLAEYNLQNMTQTTELLVWLEVRGWLSDVLCCCIGAHLVLDCLSTIDWNACGCFC